MNHKTYIGKQRVQDDLKLVDDGEEIPKSQGRGWRFECRLWNLMSTWRKICHVVNYLLWFGVGLSTFCLKIILYIERKADCAQATQIYSGRYKLPHYAMLRMEARDELTKVNFNRTQGVKSHLSNVSLHPHWPKWLPMQSECSTQNLMGVCLRIINPKYNVDNSVLFQQNPKHQIALISKIHINIAHIDWCWCEGVNAQNADQTLPTFLDWC